MNRKSLNIILILVAAFLVLGSCTSNEEQSEFSFIAACDMRASATEEFRSSEWTMGGFQAIKKVGQGSFMVSPGDVEPPWAVRELIDQVFGEDYVWYPSVGNHDLEDEKYIEYLRDYNKEGTKLPNIVRPGPPGSVETTYSFDFGNTHFVNLNLYYDGKTDGGTDGNVVPELIEWLENDLAQNKRKNTFVLGHDAIISMPDMDNGLVRHQGNVLDQYPENSFAFQQLLLKYDVTAYLCGHSHSTSFSKINGLWQLDLGHIRGMMNEFDTQKLFDYIEAKWEKDEKEGLPLIESIEKTYNSKTKSINKTLFTTQLAGVGKESYKNITPSEGKKGLLRFYREYSKGKNQTDNLTRIFWENSDWQRSSFFKITVSEEDISVKIYRDDARGGEYTLRHSFSLN